MTRAIAGGILAVAWERASEGVVDSLTSLAQHNASEFNGPHPASPGGEMTGSYRRRFKTCDLISTRPVRVGRRLKALRWGVIEARRFDAVPPGQAGRRQGKISRSHE